MRNPESKFITGLIAIWIFGVLLSLTFTGVVIWGIIKLVSHFTA